MACRTAIQDREKTEIGGGECTQKGKTQVGGNSQKVGTQAEFVFCDELKDQDIALKGDFQLADCYWHR